MKPYVKIEKSFIDMKIVEKIKYFINTAISFKILLSHQFVSSAITKKQTNDDTNKNKNYILLCILQASSLLKLRLD